MASRDSTAMPGTSPEPQGGGSPAFEAAGLSPARLLYWSMLRELWENRWTYIVPLIVAAVFLLGFAIEAGLVSSMHSAGSRSAAQAATHSLEQPFDLVSFAVMAAYVIIIVIYCLEALHGERRDRSILFWKSLPVSDLTTVAAKACFAIFILPLIAFAIIVATQGIMLLVGSAVLLGRGLSAVALWMQTPLLPMWAAMLYHLLTVHALYYAPFYGWLLLVSAWARRAPFLWAALPVAALLIVEKLVFNTSAVADMLLSRLGGGPAALPFPPPGNMPMEAPTLANLAAFLTSPGLWIGLALCAAFLAAAVRLRRYQGPI